MKTLPLTVLSLGAALLMVACGSAPTRMYALQPTAPRAGPVAYEGAPVRVAAVHLPAEMDRAEVVTEMAGGQVRIHDLDHWAAPLSKLAQQTLSADLVERLPAGKVAFPRLPASGMAAELRVDILRVSSPSQPRLAASWQLTLENHAQRSGSVDLRAAPVEASANEVAAGLSSLFGQLADAIAAELASPAPPSSTP